MLHAEIVRKLYKLSYLLWYFFILILPFGTRLIIKPHIVNGVFIEWGTISIFASEAILLLYCFIVVLLAIFDWEVIKNRLLKYKKIIIVLTVFLVLCLISTLNSKFFSSSIFQFFRLLEVSLLFLSVIILPRSSYEQRGLPRSSYEQRGLSRSSYEQRDVSRSSYEQRDDLRPNFKTTALVFSLSLIPSLIFGVFQFAFQFSPASKWLGVAEHLPIVLGTSVVGIPIGRFLRAYGTFSHPNIFAAYLVVNFWILIYLIWENKNKFWKMILFFLFFLNFYCLILTFSRASWLALAASLIVILLYCYIVKLQLNWRDILILFVFLLIFASILVYSYYDLVSSRLSADSYLESKSISERISGYEKTKEIFFENYLLGVGPGSYVFALQEKFSDLSSYLLQPVHNVWLLIGAEVGIFGLLAIVLFLISLFAFTRDFKIIIIIIGLFVLSFFDHYLWSLWQGLALVALVVSFSVMSRNRKS